MLTWIASDEEVVTPRHIDDARTVKELGRCVGIAIGRWLLSGVECPDWQATDGVSEEEANLEFDSEN